MRYKLPLRYVPRKILAAPVVAVDASSNIRSVVILLGKNRIFFDAAEIEFVQADLNFAVGFEESGGGDLSSGDNRAIE
jgi:hypothetical protein